MEFLECWIVRFIIFVLLSNSRTKIALDTSFIESQNFLAGKKIEELSKLCLEGAIALYLTDVTFNEVLSRFKKNLESADEKIKKPKKLLEDNAAILRNFKQMRPYFKLPDVDVGKLFSEFKLDFNEWITKHGVEILSSNQVGVKAILKDYFDGKPPFHSEKKKFEFPDAIALKCIEANIPSDKVYILTSDNDILDYGSKTIEPINDASALIDMIIREQSEDRREMEKAIKLIDAQIQENRSEMVTDAIENLKGYMMNEVMATEIIDGVKISDCEEPKISQLDLNNYSIINLEKNSAVVEFVATMHFEVWFSGQDLHGDLHPHQIWRYSEKEYKASDTLFTTIAFYVSFDAESNDFDYVFGYVNNGLDLGVLNSFSRYDS